MFADRHHGARLWALGAFAMLRDKAHVIADRELVEPAVRDAVAVKIDFVAVGAQNEAAILLGDKPGDPPMVRHRVQLDVPSSLANVVFEESAGGVESVPDRDVNILMSVMCGGIAADGDLAAGDLEVNADPEQIALPATRVAAFDNDPA